MKIIIKLMDNLFESKTNDLFDIQLNFAKNLFK